MSITLYRGARGKGKTITMVFDSKKAFDRGFRILTNMKELKFGEVVTAEYILNLNRKSELFNCILVIDEIELYFDSRNFSAKQNKEFSGFLQQIRKRNVHIYCTCQYVGLIDLRIRQQLDFLAYPLYDKELLICGCKYFDLTKMEDIDFDINKISYTLVVYDAIPIFNLYNTNEML